MSDIRAINKNINMKNLLTIFSLLLCAAFVSCNEAYDPDTAESLYEPSQARRVASVKTTFEENGGENIHYHRYTYDAKGRIKTVNSELVIYTPVVKDYIDTAYYRCNMTTSANYFYRGEELEVAFSVSTDYPELPSMNKLSSSSNFGVFGSNGKLLRFSQASFDYSTTMLLQAYTDGDICFDVTHDADGNITGYKKYYVTSGKVIEDRSNLYHYHPKKNKTNFDFSAYFGHWGVEQGVPVISRPYRAPYQLAAFGMLGSPSQYLPCGVFEEDADGERVRVFGIWEFDSKDYPVSYTDPDGRKTVITYCE